MISKGVRFQCLLFDRSCVMSSLIGSVVDEILLCVGLCSVFLDSAYSAD
jgi:hypothetical protein